MAIIDWIWCVFIFAFGCCIGSFLNVVIYRLPREKSLVHPGSYCPGCGKHIRWYDNIPLVSWLVLRAKCRNCKTSISPRYFIIELLTGLIFIGLYVLYFHTSLRDTLKVEGGWFVYLLHLIMLAGFIAASAIDLELWIIPLSICWFVTVAGFVSSAVGPYIVHPLLIKAYWLLPRASPASGAMAVGAAIGLAVSWILLLTGLLKRSYDADTESNQIVVANEVESRNHSKNQFDGSADMQFNHRIETCKEIVFLLPIVGLALAALWCSKNIPIVRSLWPEFSQNPAVAGFLGSVWGYFVGCAVVWITRILGTLAFGREAMGLGDVHLMGAAGAVVGPILVVLAFFVAPFFGLGWAVFQMFFRKIRQIPYGPFLSLGVLTVMIFHDWVLNRFAFIFFS